MYVLLHLSLSSVILIDSLTESPVHVLVLSSQAVRCSLHYLFLHFLVTLFPRVGVVQPLLTVSNISFFSKTAITSLNYNGLSFIINCMGVILLIFMLFIFRVISCVLICLG